MTDLPSPHRIRDPIHGYITVTSVERAVLDETVSQRLRYISQNGLAQLVYPEATTSRFVHSLGAMHLASQFLASFLRNTDSSTLLRVEAGIELAVRHAAGHTGNPARAADNLPTDFLLAERFVSTSSKPFTRLVEQGLRLAALFHDLGHLPFSHDFESALTKFWHRSDKATKDDLRDLVDIRPGQEQIHERVGHSLAQLLLQHAVPENEGATLSFEIAYRILTSSERPFDDDGGEVLNWLHSLIASEIDVDRCDYILRDARNYGFEFADYDLQRLLDNLVIAPLGESSYVSAIRPHGISAIESLLLARYRSYQYAVRHHKVAQVGCALVYAICRTLEARREGSVGAFLGDLKVLSTGAELEDEERRRLLGRISMYDDGWWRGVMREVAREIVENEGNRDEWLDLVCWRRPGPVSLWKRVGDFPVSVAEWNRRAAAMERDKSPLYVREFWEAKMEEFEARGLLLVRHRFVPWKESPESGGSLISVQLDSELPHKLTPVSQLSPLVLSLSDAWMNDVQVQVFARSPGVMEGVDKAELVENLVS